MSFVCSVSTVLNTRTLMFSIMESGTQKINKIKFQDNDVSKQRMTPVLCTVETICGDLI